MKIVIVDKANKELNKLPSGIREKIRAKLLDLKNNPISSQTKKLTEQPGYRLRVGDYRILYIIELDTSRIIIFRIRHRKDVYRNMSSI